MGFWFLRCRASSRASAALLGALLIAVTACSGPVWAKAADGTVKVFYPDSLAHVMQHDIAPAFEQATGYRVAGYHARSAKLASEIQEKAQAVDVLISASPEANLELMGSSRGDWVEWYAIFMQSPLVVGYDHKSKFAAELTSKPWYQVAAEPGFRLGLTDPNKDAKGRLTAKALQRVVQNHNRQGLEKKLAANSRIVPAQDLSRRLQSHQLDAAFFYQSEAAATGIPNVPVDMGNISAFYTVTILNHAPHPGPASAFVAFLLGGKGKQIIKKSSGLELMPSTAIFGNVLAVPSALRPLLGTQ